MQEGYWWNFMEMASYIFDPYKLGVHLPQFIWIFKQLLGIETMHHGLAWQRQYLPFSTIQNRIGSYNHECIRATVIQLLRIENY